MSPLLILSGITFLTGCPGKTPGDSGDSGEACNAIWFADADGDGFGDADTTSNECEAPSGYVDNADDCDDSSADALPGGTEVCDGLDNDCDGEIDPATSTDATTWFMDTDGDGYGDPAAGATSCEQPSSGVEDDTDCDDMNAEINPAAEELCDTVDNNCDGLIDEDTAIDAGTWYADTDADGLGDADDSWVSCEPPSGYVENWSDCDDAHAEILECCTDGPDGVWHATADTTIAGGVHEVESFVIDAGVTVTVTGGAPLMVYAQTVDISGTLDATGGDGASSGSASVPNGGDAVGGGGGGGGGGHCGNGEGAGGWPNGSDAETGYAQGGGGGLPWGLSTWDHDRAQGGEFGPGGGGGAGGAAADGTAGKQAEHDGTVGLGGTGFGDETLEDVFTGGSGGAGGGANGGGGGAGGGAIAFHANNISVSGTVDVSGGQGGGKDDGSCTSGGGGGGGGGMVWLHADVVEVTGTLDATGGLGAPEDAETDQYGGDGADGRIRISGALISNTGTVGPEPYSDAVYPECAYEGDTDIYALQDGSTAENTWVDVHGVIVTGIAENGFFVQEEAGGQESGIWVYTTSGVEWPLVVGDVLNIYGEYYEYDDLSELDASAGWVTYDSLGTEPTPEIITAADLGDAAIAELYEGVLVHVEDAEVTDADLGYGEFECDTYVVVDDLIYDWSEDFSGLYKGDTFTDVIGPLNYSFGAYKIEPRDIDDLDGYAMVPR
ncbi:MAG: hypothetical protein GY884_00750 [Proteobacteria bacterium]|nr:hypothetical protein [Pseudomonadota bacterium]